MGMGMCDVCVTTPWQNDMRPADVNLLVVVQAGKKWNQRMGWPTSLVLQDLGLKARLTSHETP